MEVVPIPIKDTFADPDFNCRGKIVPVDVTELMNSIESNGLLQPIVVQPFDNGKFKYRVIMGHRRFEACKLLKWSDIPGIIRAGLTELQARSDNLVENLARQDLNLMQEAKAIEKLVCIGATRDEICQLINKSLGWLNIRIQALRLPEEIQQEIAAGFINQEQVRDLQKVSSREEQFRIVRDIKDARLRGTVGRIKVKHETKAKVYRDKRPRNISEILLMQQAIQDNIGNNLATRLAAWAMGEITGDDFVSDIRQATEALGRVFTPPEDYVAA